MMTIRWIGQGVFVVLLMIGRGGGIAAAPVEPGQQVHVTFAFTAVTGIGWEKDVCRRDPSDIIRVGDTCFIWYSRVRRGEVKPGRHGYPSGYQASVWYAVSRDEGRTWKEMAQAIARGPDGAFDCTGVFTPNILVWRGKYYLYYTAVGPDFDNGPYEDRNRTAMGVAVAEAPGGPWKKLLGHPVLRSSRDPERFDSYRVDDSCFIVRHNTIWMYYKGRQWNNTPAHTKMGVAVADNPAGPFRRLNNGRYVQDSGHEVLVWPDRGGVMSLVSRYGPHGQTLQYAPDGIGFHVVGRLPGHYPHAPGLFRADLTGADAADRQNLWGISMAVKQGDPYLQRYEMRIHRGAR